MIYLLTAIGLTPGGSSTVHIYTQTVHRTTQNKQYIEEHNNLWECGPCHVLARKKVHAGLWWGNLRERVPWKVLG